MLEEGVTYRVETDGLTGSLDTLLTVYDAEGRVLVSDDDGGPTARASRVRFTALLAAEAFLQVSAWPGTSGGFTMRIVREGIDAPADDHGDAPAAATPLAVDGPPGAGAIGRGDRDCFRVTLSAGVRYVAETSDLAGGMDTFLVLLGPDRVLEVASDDDGGREDLASRIVWTPSSDGAWYLLVSYAWRRSGTGTYRLAVRQETAADDHGDTLDTATGLAADGAPVGGRIEAPGDVDAFRVAVEAGVTYRLQTTDLSPRMDTVLELRDAAGILLARNDDGDAVSLASRMDWSAPATGTCLVTVRHFDPAGTGQYRLAVGPRAALGGEADDHGNTPATATALVSGVPAAGAIEVPGDWDTFRIQGRAGGAYRVTTADLAAGMDTTLTLLAADGTTVLARDDDGGGTPLASRLAWTATTDGPVYVEVAHFRRTAGTGLYRLDLAVRSAGADDHGDDASGATSVSTGGQAVGGEIEEDHDRDVFAFPARAADVHTIALSGVTSGFDPVLDLLAPDGVEVLASDDDGAGGFVPRLLFTAPADGTYYVAIRSYGLARGTGAYTLRIRRNADLGDPDDHADEADRAAPIAPTGVEVAGRLETPGDLDCFALAVAAGVTYRVETKDLSEGCDTRLALLGEDGWTLLAEDDDGGDEPSASRFDWTAPTSGTRTIRVQHYRPTGTGTYRLRVSVVSGPGGGDDHDDLLGPGATPLAPDGDAAAGVIDTVVDVDTFRFEARAGGLYTLWTDDLADGMDSVLTVLAGAGEVLAEDDDAGPGLASRLAWIAPADGTYHLSVAHRLFGTGRGSYRVGVAAAHLVDLEVALEGLASADLLGDVEAAVRVASEALAAATGGRIALGAITARPGVTGDAWTLADLQVAASDPLDHPLAGTKGSTVAALAEGPPFLRTRIDRSVATEAGIAGGWIARGVLRTRFGLLAEDRGPAPDGAGGWLLGPAACGSGCLMEAPASRSLCVAHDHDPDRDTLQSAVRGTSCWDTLAARAPWITAPPAPSSGGGAGDRVRWRVR